MEPSDENDFLAEHATLMMGSFRHLLGRELLPQAEARALYHAPFPILSHNTAEDPVLTYGNLAAQALWQMGWAQLTAMPSRLTAEPGHRAQRDAMFARMRQQGYVDDYAGVRISATGTRFEIRDAIIWTLYDQDGVKQGEAACFSNFAYL